MRERLEQREADFLALAQCAIYANLASPYRHLLRLAGCEYGDLVHLVHREGLEGALQILARQGVYLTVDELKGRQPVVRGGEVFHVGLDRLRNPRSASHLAVSSSGRSGASATGVIDLASVFDQAVDLCLLLAARGGLGWRKALWGVPGSAALTRVLDFSTCGAQPTRWFTQIDPRAAGLHPRYRWSIQVLRWASRVAGRPLPKPTYVPLDDPLPVARWLADLLREGETPLLWTHTSPAVRVAQAAVQAGFDLHGAQLSLGGEPTTEVRLATIERAGLQAVPHYATMECGLIGYGCLSPDGPDDLHLLSDLHAVIRAQAEERDVDDWDETLLVSSLRPTARFILLNASLGDRADLSPRACGCPLETIGWTTHLQTVRSFAKLTVGGMALLDQDVIRVLEQDLPARFGGGPTDYQLIEGEEDDGRPRLTLLVRPSVGQLDPTAVRDAFLTAIGRGSGVERVTELQWRQGDWVQVERRAPLSTPGGKILHLWRRPAAESGGSAAQRAEVSRSRP